MTPQNNLFTLVLVAGSLFLVGCRPQVAKGMQPSEPEGGVEPSMPLVSASPLVPTTVPGPVSSAQDQPVASDGTGSSAAGPVSVSPAKSQVTGRVLDGSGKPIAGASVVVAEGTGPVPELAVLTSANGTYTWSLPAGKFKLAVYKDGFPSQTKEVTVSAGRATTLDFTLASN